MNRNTSNQTNSTNSSSNSTTSSVGHGGAQFIQHLTQQQMSSLQANGYQIQQNPTGGYFIMPPNKQQMNMNQSNPQQQVQRGFNVNQQRMNHQQQAFGNGQQFLIQQPYSTAVYGQAPVMLPTQQAVYAIQPQQQKNASAPNGQYNQH